MRRRIGIFGATDESLRLVSLLIGNPEIEVVRVWDADVAAALARARTVDPGLADGLQPVLTSDLDEFIAGDSLDAVIDASGEDAFQSALPNAAERGVQVVTPLAARLLWAYGAPARDRKAELLQALSEVVESVELTIDSDELFARMLDIAVGVTGADGGSLMLLDDARRELRVRVALGVEPELWPKIRVPLGEGIAGRVAADARPLRVAGKADHATFRIVRERSDVESAISAPLVHEGRVLGVLNLHHSTRQEAFDEGDLDFVEQLAQLDAQIIARAQEHESLRNQAARYTAVREVRGILATPDPLLERLRALCVYLAGRIGGGIVNLYLGDTPNAPELRLAATSLEGGGFAGEYRVVSGQGIDGRVAAGGRPTLLRGEDGRLEYVALPLLAGERNLGVLSLQTGAAAAGGRAVEEMLFEMAAAVAEGVAQAQREGRMSARATRMSAINETGIRMLSAQETTEVVRLATSSAAMILDGEHAVLRLQDDKSRRYVIRSYFGPADGRGQEQLFRLDKRVSVETIKRRGPRLVRDLGTASELAGVAGGFRSLLAAPLRRDGVVVGTLALYDKIAADRFYAGSFDDDDLQVFSRFVGYVERALAQARERAHAKQHRNFDDDTGLPNEKYLDQRVSEEIARASGRHAALALVSCRIENLDDIARRASVAHAHRVVLRTADALRTHLRNFDVLGRTGPDAFGVLMPDPGPSAGDRVFALARAVADAISKDDALNQPERVALAFGYAIHPEDGSDRDALASAAEAPRIRMV